MNPETNNKIIHAVTMLLFPVKILLPTKLISLAWLLLDFPGSISVWVFIHCEKCDPKLNLSVNQNKVTENC